MALKGNLQKIEYIDHESELVDWVTINEQGEEVATKAPRKIKSSTDYNDVYLTIKQIDLFSQCCNDGLSIVFIYAVYESEQARIDDVEDCLYTKTGMLFNYDHDLNLYTQIYDSIKLEEGNTNLING
jgi:predicted DNA-binding protein YlxM (UPF0122 family)